MMRCRFAIVLLALSLGLLPGLVRAQTQPAQPAGQPQAAPQDPMVIACLKEPNADKRLAACAQLLKAHPNDPSFSWALNIRGNTYSLQKNDLVNAMKEYDAAVKLNPKDPQAYNNRGTVHLQQGQYAPAVQDYTSAIAADPSDDAAYNNRAMANFRLGKIDQSVQDFTMAIKLRPNYADAYESRGIIYYAQDKTELAFADFSRAVSSEAEIGRSAVPALGRLPQEGPTGRRRFRPGGGQAAGPQDRRKDGGPGLQIIGFKYSASNNPGHHRIAIFPPRASHGGRLEGFIESTRRFAAASRRRPEWSVCVPGWSASWRPAVPPPMRGSLPVSSMSGRHAARPRAPQANGDGQTLPRRQVHFAGCFLGVLDPGTCRGPAWTMAKDNDRPQSDAAKPKPNVSPRGQQLEAERRQREAAALRENLARRKAQQRARRLPPSLPSANSGKAGD